MAAVLLALAVFAPQSASLAAEPKGDSAKEAVNKPAHEEKVRRGSGLPVPRFASMRSDEVNVRAGPGTRYPVEWVFQRKNMPVEVVAEFLSSRTEQLRTSVSVVAADFGLKEAVATTDSETIRSVLANHGQRVGADIMLLVGLDGVRIAGTAPLPRTRFELQLAAGGDDDGSLPRHYLESDGADAYEWFAVPLRAPTTIAWIVAGFHAGGEVGEVVVAEVRLPGAG